MKLEEPYCSACGSTDIAKDAFATWDMKSQQWELHSTYDNSKCLNEDCEADDSIEWREVEKNVAVGDLDSPVPNHLDQSKRGFSPQ